MAKRAEDVAMDEALRIGEIKAENAKKELATYKAEAVEREKQLAVYHEVVGQVKTANMVREFLQISRLVWIQQVRDNKLYKEFGTWETFCESIGYTRQHVEDQLKNLAAFGEKFTQTVCGLGVSYRDLRKLRQLTHDGTIVIEADALVIGDEVIPFDADHKEDLQAAIETVIENAATAKSEAAADISAKDRVLKAKEDVIKKQERDLAKLSKEARKKGLTPEEDTYIQRMQVTRDALDGFIGDLDAEQGAVPPAATPRMIAAYLETVGYFKRVIATTHEAAIGMYGDPASDEVVGWQQPAPKAEIHHEEAALDQ